MTQEEFIKILKKEGIKFTIDGETIVISNNNNGVFLSFLITIPKGVRFENNGWVWLSSLTTISEGVRFENNGNVWLDSLTTIPKGTRFENNGEVYLNSNATRFNPILRNKGIVHFVSYHNKMKLRPTNREQHGIKLIFEK